ncbi:hypothetical protein EVAR_76896_1 [Eumeta japonica]|uniref:Uncharacterized protein n=1 Tax=Eumeta variegata TaxID=151549 RepID=A0A4C1SFF4_EUMVA|nr:hypothetical protein EVAR_76896_1 [Eumeta japonica]
MKRSSKRAASTRTAVRVHPRRQAFAIFRVELIHSHKINEPCDWSPCPPTAMVDKDDRRSRFGRRRRCYISGERLRARTREDAGVIINFYSDKAMRTGVEFAGGIAEGEVPPLVYPSVVRTPTEEE